jgi:uncharacterized protein (TIRG00374 family)
MKLFHTVCALFGILLLAWLIWRIGPASLWSELTQIGWGLVPLVLIEGVADIFHTLGWRRCLSGSHRSLPFWRIFRIRLAGASINYITPTGLGGEVIKGTLLSSNHQGAEAASGVIVGKLAYTLARLLFVAVGSTAVLWRTPLPVRVWTVMLIVTGFLVTGILIFIALQKHGKLGAIVRWLIAHRLGGRLLQKAAGPLSKVDTALALFYRERPWDLPLAMSWHVIGLGVGIVQSWYFLFLLTDRASLLSAAAVWFLGGWMDVLSIALPFDVGVMEATRVITFRVLGFYSALGLTYGIALRIEQVFWAGVGLLIYATLVTERRRTSPMNLERP